MKKIYTLIFTLFTLLLYGQQINSINGNAMVSETDYTVDVFDTYDPNTGEARIVKIGMEILVPGSGPEHSGNQGFIRIYDVNENLLESKVIPEYDSGNAGAPVIHSAFVTNTEEIYVCVRHQAITPGAYYRLYLYGAGPEATWYQEWYNGISQALYSDKESDYFINLMWVAENYDSGPYQPSVAPGGSNEKLTLVVQNKDNGEKSGSEIDFTGFVGSNYLKKGDGYYWDPNHNFVRKTVDGNYLIGYSRYNPNQGSINETMRQMYTLIDGDNPADGENSILWTREFPRETVLVEKPNGEFIVQEPTVLGYYDENGIWQDSEGYFLRVYDQNLLNWSKQRSTDNAHLAKNSVFQEMYVINDKLIAFGGAFPNSNATTRFEFNLETLEIITIMKGLTFGDYNTTYGVTETWSMSILEDPMTIYQVTANSHRKSFTYDVDTFESFWGSGSWGAQPDEGVFLDVSVDGQAPENISVPYPGNTWMTGTIMFDDGYDETKVPSIDNDAEGIVVPGIRPDGTEAPYVVTVVYPEGTDFSSFDKYEGPISAPNGMYIADYDYNRIVSDITASGDEVYYCVTYANNNPSMTVNSNDVKTSIAVTIYFSTDQSLIPEQTNTVGDELLDNNAYTVFPNPFSDTFYIQTDKSLTLNQFYLYNQLGQCVLTERHTTVETTHLTPGVYYLKIETDQGIGIKQLIKY
ncbi:MAG: hypothetical protein CSA40_00880 [Flavobacteriales bacterium]|nr:MAG: hypothetical protein CSA40_00880 [Flavobacteriales bacterium]